MYTDTGQDLTREEFPQHNAEGPYIGGRVVTQAVEHLERERARARERERERQTDRERERERQRERERESGQ